MGTCGYVIIGVGLHVTSRELGLCTGSDDTVVVVAVVVPLPATNDAAECPTEFGDGGTGSVCI